MDMSYAFGMISDHLNLIIPHLFVGNSHSARTSSIISENDITAIVNVAKDLDDPWLPEVQLYKFGIVDGASHENHSVTYALAARTVLTLLDRGETVLLHCHEGISRSVAVAVLVVSKFNGMSLDQAYGLVGTQRPIAFINKGHKIHIEEARKMLDAAW